MRGEKKKLPGMQKGRGGKNPVRKEIKGGNGGTPSKFGPTGQDVN